MFDGWDLVAEPPPAERDFQSVEIGGRQFAVPAEAVRAELGPLPATPVPGALRFVRGVLMWEGQVVPVLDTSARLLLPTMAGSERPKPLVHLEVGGETFFLEVDSVGETISGGRLEPTEGEVPMILGFIAPRRDEVGDGAGERIPVLDLDALIDFGDLGDSGDSGGLGPRP